MKMKLFSIFLILNLIFSSAAHAYTATYDTSMRVGSAWKTVRTAIKNNPLGKSPQGILLGVASVYVGDKLVTEYQNGTFDANIETMKQGIAEMYSMGVEATGWLKEQFNKLQEQNISCQSGSCTKPNSDINNHQFTNGVYFTTQNGTTRYTSVNDYVRNEIAKPVYYDSYSLGSYQGQTLTELLASNTTGGTLRLEVNVTCPVRCTTDHLGNPVKTNTIVADVRVWKPEARPFPVSSTSTTVSTAQMAEVLDEPTTEQKQVEVVATCFLTNCSSIPIRRSEPSSVPQTYTPNGADVEIKYPAPPLVLNSDGTITKDGAIVEPSTGEADANDGVKPNPLGNFCSWAKPVCDLKTWLMDTDVPEPEVKPIQEIDTSKAPEAKVWSSGSRQCPPSPTIPIEFLNTSFTLQLTPLCDFLSSIRNFILASAYLGAAFIIFNYRRS